MALEKVFPITDSEKIVIDIIIETMIRGMQEVEDNGKVTGSFKEILIILSIPEKEYLGSIKHRITEAKEIFDRPDFITILDKFDIRLFTHTLVNAYNTPEFHYVIAQEVEQPTHEVIRSLWNKLDLITKFWNKSKKKTMLNMLDEIFGKLNKLE